jgi:hypothetical protein
MMEFDAAFIDAAKHSSIEFSRKELGQEIHVMRETHNYLFFGPVRKDEKNTAYFSALYLFKKKMHLQPGQKVTLYDHDGEFGLALVGQAQNRQVWVWLLSFETNEIVKKSISLVHSVTGVQSPEELQVCKESLARYEKRSSRKRMERQLQQTQHQPTSHGGGHLSPLVYRHHSYSSSAPSSPTPLSPSTSLASFSSMSLGSESPVESPTQSPSRTPITSRRTRSHGRYTRDYKRKTNRYELKDSVSDDEEDEEEEFETEDEEAEDEHDIIEDNEEYVNFSSRSPRSPRRQFNNRSPRNALSPIKKKEINNQLNKKENMKMFMKLLEYVLTITENPEADEDDK